MKRFLCILICILLPNFFFGSILCNLKYWKGDDKLNLNNILSITQDYYGYIWLLNSSHTLIRYTGFDFEPVIQLDNPYNFITNQQKNILVESSSCLKGLNCLSYRMISEVDSIDQDVSYKWIKSYRKNSVTLQNKQIKFKETFLLDNLPIPDIDNIASDSKGNIWFSMPYWGLGYVDGETHKLYTIKNISQSKEFVNGYNTFLDVLDYKIDKIFIDSKDNLWLATHSNGLIYLAFKSSFIHHYQFNYNNDGIARKDVSCPFADSDDNIWITTFGGGIGLWNQSILSETTYLDFGGSKITNGNRLGGVKMYPLLELKKHKIWMGSLCNGLFESEKCSNGYRLIKHNKDRNSSDINVDSITGLAISKENILWIGTNSGLLQYDINNNIYFVPNCYHDFCKLVKNHCISYILETPKEIWVSTLDHLFYMFDKTENRIYRCTSEDGLMPTIYCGDFLIKKKRWFFGNSGVWEYAYKENDRIVFKCIHSLGNIALSNLESAQKDLYNRLWIGSEKGLIVYDINTKKASYIEGCKGVYCNSFTQGFSKTQNGDLLFGARNGFYKVDPRAYEEYLKNRTCDNFWIDKIIVNRDTLSKQKLYECQRSQKYIKLPSNSHSLCVEIGSLGNLYFENSQYTYQLIGKDSTKILTNQPKMQWDNLSYGEYVLNVRNVYTGKEILLNITVDTPWYLTILGIVFLWVGVLFFLTIVVLLFVRFVKFKAHQREKGRFDEMRFRFFLNLTHEVRTPLALIRGGVDRLKRDPLLLNKEIDRIDKSISRLHTLVGDVLSLRYTDNVEIRISKRSFDFIEFVYGILNVFKLKESTERIYFHCNQKSCWIYSDRFAIETILYNLLSNGLKYSKEDSNIYIEMKKDDQELMFSVTSFGTLIDEQDKKRLFDRYYQVSKGDGVGIGLNLVKEYVLSLSGAISISSSIEMGNKFTVTIPIEKDPKERENCCIEKRLNSENKETVLVVEDQKDMQLFFKDLFSDYYNVFIADHGNQALEIIDQCTPQIIVSDLMMPLCDGFELCRKVKRNPSYSHIPFVLITAKNHLSVERESAELGIDLFIEKPFDYVLLLSKIKMLLKRKNELRQFYQKEARVQLEECSENPLDKHFLQRLQQTILQNITSNELNVTMLSSLMSMSTSSLYKKCKSLTGQTPVELIRIERLKEGARLLRESEYTILEISENSGFNCAKYFTKQFKAQFSITPSEYRKNRNNAHTLNTL